MADEDWDRTFNSLNDLYLLPTDESEWRRLDKQHSALTIAFGGLYPCPEVVERVLVDDGTRKEVLDVGCGTGAWAIEMARRFPHATIKAVDLAPLPVDSSTLPENMEFELDDINLGLHHFYDQFDLVHMRLVRSGLKDNRATIYELEQCLKPGGMLLVIEADTEFHDRDFKKAKMARVDGDEDVDGVSSETGSWFMRMHWEAVETHGIAADDMDLTSEFIDHGFWSHPLIDPETVISGTLYMPIGPWVQVRDPVESQLLKFIGMLWRQNMGEVHEAYHPSLLRYGLSPETLKEWSRLSQEEVDTHTPPILLRLPFCMGRRRAGDGLAAPPVPALASQSSSAEETETPRLSSPFFETYHTAKEAAEARTRRRETQGSMPTAAVRRAWATLQNQNEETT